MVKRDFYFWRFLSGFLVLTICLNLATPAFALRPQAVPETLRGASSLQEAVQAAGAPAGMEERWASIGQSLNLIQDAGLHSETETVLRAALAGQSRFGVSGTVPASVKTALTQFSNDPAQQRLQGVQAMIEWLAYRWAREKESSDGVYQDTFAHYLQTVVVPEQADRLIHYARQMGIPVYAYPSNFTARRAGIILPPYAARSEQDEGIGDLAVLDQVVEWAHHHGLQQIYLMPIYEIDWVDPSPYLTASQFGANVISIRLKNVPEAQRSKRVQLELGRYGPTIERLRREAKVDYPTVLDMKFSVLRAAHGFFIDQVYVTDANGNLDEEAIRRKWAERGEPQSADWAIARARAFEQFRREHGYWLQIYADFRSVANTFHVGWKDFPGELRGREANAMKIWRKHTALDISFFEYVQFLFEEQWKPIRDKAHRYGIRLMGDMPGGVDGDAFWAFQNAFDTSGTMGAAADRYSVVGQDWGGPTYDWNRQRAAGFPLHMMRISRLTELFDDVRGDYWVGYGRYFWIPVEYAPENFKNEPGALRAWVQQVWRKNFDGQPFPLSSESLAELHSVLAKMWNKKYGGEQFPLVAISSRTEFERRINETVQSIEEAAQQSQDDREIRKAAAARKSAEEAIAQQRHTWAPDEPRYQTPAFFLTDGTSANLTDKDRQIWILTILKFLAAEYRPGPGHDLMQGVLRWVMYERLGQLSPEDFGDGFPDVDRLRQELGFPRVRPLLFGLSGWGPYWDTRNTGRQSFFNDGRQYQYHSNTDTYSTTHDGPTLKGEILDLIQGDPKTRRQPDPDRVRWLVEKLRAEGIPVDWNPGLSAERQAEAIFQALMTKSARSNGKRALWMYQDLWGGLGNDFRSTPPGDALGEKWRDRPPAELTMEALEANQAPLAQRANELVDRLMNDPQADRRIRTIEPGELPRILGMLPREGKEQGVRVQQIRHPGEKVQAYAVVSPAKNQTQPGQEPRVELAVWNLDNQRQDIEGRGRSELEAAMNGDRLVAGTIPMRFHSVLPDGTYLYYGEFTAPQRVGEFVMMTRVADVRGGWHWFTTEFEQEPLLIIRKPADFPDPVQALETRIRQGALPEEKVFHVGQHLFGASGPVAGSPKLVEPIDHRQIYLVHVKPAAGNSDRWFVAYQDALSGGVVFEEQPRMEMQPSTAVAVGELLKLAVPDRAPPLELSIHHADIDVRITTEKQPHLEFSWGPDTPPFDVYRLDSAQSLSTSGGQEESLAESSIFETRFRATEQVLAGSGQSGGSPVTVPDAFSNKTFLVEISAPDGPYYYFVNNSFGSRSWNFFTGGDVKFQPGDLPVESNTAWSVKVPKSLEPPGRENLRLDSFDIEFSGDKDSGMRVSWGPDMPPFKIFRTEAAGQEETLPLPRLATSVLHYRYGRSPRWQDVPPAGPDQQFERSTVAAELIRVLGLPNGEGYPLFIALMQKMALLTTPQYGNLTPLLGTQTEWGNDIPPSVVTADLSRIFSDLVRFRWDLKPKLYDWLVRLALSKELDSAAIQLAVDILRSAEVGEIVLVGLQSAYSSNTGGMGPYTLELTRGLAKMGINVTVIVPMFQENKTKILAGRYPRDTGRSVTVPFVGGEQAVLRLYEARSEEGVRVIYFENDRYFQKLAKRPNEPEGAGVYGSSGPFQLRVARVLSLGALLAIRELRIHPSVIQTNDDHSGLLAMYLRQGERDDAHPDTRGDDVDINIRFSNDPSLNQTRVVHVIHALTDGYNLEVNVPTAQWQDIVLHDLGRDWHLRDLDSLNHPAWSSGTEKTISPLHAAIVHADEVLTVSGGFYKDSLTQPGRFHGFTSVLQWKAEQGAYHFVPNGFDTIGLQRHYFPELPQTFLEMGVEAGRRWWAWHRLFYNFDGQGIPVVNRGLGLVSLRKRALQEAFNFPQDGPGVDAFLYSTLARVEEVKGHHLLTAPIWSVNHPEEISYYQGDHHGYKEKPFMFEGHKNEPVSDENQKKLTAYARRRGLESLSALEVALILMPNLQVLIAGPADLSANNLNGEIARDLQAIQQRFAADEPSRRHFAFYPRGVYKGRDAAYNLIYTGSTVFGMPSKSESFGLAALEAMAGGVPTLQSNRGGLRDMAVHLQRIQSDFETYHPISWLMHLSHYYDAYYGDRDLWDEFRYWSVAERDFRGQPRGYRNVYRTMWQRVLHGGTIPDAHGEWDVELPVFEMSAAINRSISARKSHSADELKAAGFSVQDANNALVVAIRDSVRPDFLHTVIDRFLPTLARIPDPKLQSDLLNRINTAIDSADIAGNSDAKGRLIWAKTNYWKAVGQAGAEESIAEAPKQTRAVLAEFSPSAISRRQIHIFDPINADLGLLVSAIQKDPVVIIAENETQERAIHQSGFLGMTVNQELYPDLPAAREAALVLVRDNLEFSGFSPFYYTAEQRASWKIWLAGILEHYEITALSLDQAAQIVESLATLQSA